MADVYTMATDLLDRVAAYFAEHSVTLPAVRYVAPGNSQAIAWDEDADGVVRECVMVAVDFVSPGQPGADEGLVAGAMKHGTRRYAQFAVTVIRSAAIQDENGASPAPAVIQADGQANVRDVETLHRALEYVRAGSTAAGGWAERGTPVLIGRTQTFGPAGAACGVVGVIQAVIL